MKPENDQKLVEAFPLLYADRFADMRKTCMCWGFDVGDGWFDIVWRLSEKLEAMIKEYSSAAPDCAECGHTSLVHDSQDLENRHLPRLCSIEEADWECPCTGFERYAPRASQVKEKFGTLRFYMSSSTPEMEKAIEEAEAESVKTCENCGASGTLLEEGGWYRTLCEKCR